MTFTARHEAELQSLLICNVFIECRTVLGSSKRICSLVPEQIRGLLPDMLELARGLEDALASPQSP